MRTVEEGGAGGASGRTALVDLVSSPERRQAYLRAGHWDGSTLPRRVEHHARHEPDRIAVVDVDASRRHTYGELARDVASFGRWLASSGVSPGDVVSSQLPNWYPFVVAAIGALEVGAVVNPLLPAYRRRELQHVFAVARPKVVCTPRSYRGHDHLSETAAVIEAWGHPVSHVLVDRPGATGGGSDPGAGPSDGRTTTFEGIVGSAGPGAGARRDGGAGARRDGGPADRDAAAVSELIFTSGTEAAPKAIMHTEQTANFSVRTAQRDLEMSDDDVVWMPSPIGHSTGFNYGVRFALYHGLPLVLQDRWDPEVAARLIAEHGASYTLASTTFLQDLVTEAERRDLELPTMSRFGCGGAPVPAELVHRAAKRGIGVLRLYGSTEVLVATWNRPDSPAHKRAGTDGSALSDVEVEVRDEEGRRCAPNAVGEIHVRGPNTCVGFYEDPGRTAATFDVDGWVRSGDLAAVDAEGYLTVVGRKKEIIIRGGLNITPREIEDLMIEWPEVDRVAVVGLPDDRLGERTCACVVLVPGARLEHEAVVERLRSDGLATYKLPERLEVLDELPMTPSGKVQKFEIVSRLVAR
jgi:acyl-CoA synthetase (AMP-forming)/AMP-acid ligase II